ncbi:MAG: hypothetical protein FWD41_03770, partial [Actinomycetia bacterium]|nr:hypothetical protein [Actinomycetes bacterium]
TSIFDKDFPAAGVYVYEITEFSPTYVLNPAPPPTETMTYSTAKYEITVFVKNSADGTFRYVTAVSAVVKVADNDTQIVGDKVTPELGNSAMTFTNVYTRTTGDGPPDGNNEVLSVSKVVSGDFGDQTYYFPFSVMLTKNPLVDGTPIYKGYILDVDGTIVGATDLADAAKNNATIGGVDGEGNSYIAFSSTGGTGSGSSFKLMHGQRLVFTDLPIGTAYVVDESATINYTPFYTITYAGDVGDEVAGSLSGALGTGAQLVGVNPNSAAFRNNRDNIVPGGIDINDLPFIGMIVLAILILAGYLYARSRKRYSYQ